MMRKGSMRIIANGADNHCRQTKTVDLPALVRCFVTESEFLLI
jgi:hypothetical protein